MNCVNMVSDFIGLRLCSQTHFGRPSSADHRPNRGKCQEQTQSRGNRAPYHASKLELGSSLRWTATEINGRPAMISIAEGDPMTAITIESDGERITAIYVQRNPDKLVRLSQALGMSIISS